MFHSNTFPISNETFRICNNQRVLREMFCTAGEIAHRRFVNAENEVDRDFSRSEKFLFEDALETLDAELSSLDYPDMDARRTLGSTLDKAQRLIKEQERERHIAYHSAVRWFTEQ